ncbi:hypothetical protein FLL45_17950 [Aliikangiella marina]|uniref:Regulator SirB n=2 Tax=Aliikangiella marina TaxID=1712262 RepID=A0A545T5B2_9GAMM|nr:hypothetical protein FLL45_17950 [Aliikangiella marina]
MLTATLSLVGFLLRGYWMMTDNKLLGAKPVKILPHINDTILLGAAIYLVVITQMYPFVVNWITAKVVLLVVYIVAGVFALKRGKTKQIRSVAFVIAVASVLGMFYLASAKPALAF